METIFRTRYVSVVAVVFGAVGAVLMFLIGAVTTVKSVGVYFGTGKAKAFSSDAALEATIDLVSALDQFLLGLVLLVFAYGVYSLWVVADREAWDEEKAHVKAPDWLFLKGALNTTDPSEFSDLVIPIAVVLFALTVWFIRRSETH